MVSTASTVSEGVSYSVNSINSVENTVNEVKPSVVDVVNTDEIKPSANSGEETLEDRYE